MWLHWVSESGKARRHAPDFFVRRADGTSVLIDVRPDNRIGAADASGSCCGPDRTHLPAAGC